MKNSYLIFAFFFLFSCHNLVEKPDHLISKDKMAEILLDIAINEQAGIVNSKANMEIGTRYVLKKHQVSAKEFADSYQYYTLKKDLPKIVENAQENLKNRYPELEKKLKENTTQNETSKIPEKTLEGRPNQLNELEELENKEIDKKLLKQLKEGK